MFGAPRTRFDWIVWDQKPAEATEPINWVELKTTATIQSDRDMLKYERKLLKFWIQSFLVCLTFLNHSLERSVSGIVVEGAGDRGWISGPAILSITEISSRKAVCATDGDLQALFAATTVLSSITEQTAPEGRRGLRTWPLTI